MRWIYIDRVLCAWDKSIITSENIYSSIPESPEDNESPW